MKRSIRASVTLMTASALVLAGSIPAMASENTRLAESSISSETAATEYTDYDVISFLALGTGKITDDHESLAPYAQASADVPVEAQQEINDLFLAAAPDFHERVTEPLQSGDPRLAEQALGEYTAISYDVAAALDIDVEGNTEFSTTAAITFVVVVFAVAGAVAATVAAGANVRYVWNTVEFWGTSVEDTTISTEKRAAALALAFGK
jgi:SdpC family antimicrobial peptide